MRSFTLVKPYRVQRGEGLLCVICRSSLKGLTNSSAPLVLGPGKPLLPRFVRRPVSSELSAAAAVAA